MEVQITLERLLNNLCQLAVGEKLVNYAASSASFNTINNLTVTDYPVIFIQPYGQHTYTEERTTYSLNIYFLDRLLSDDTNDIAVYSTAIEELKNYIKLIRLEDYVLRVDDYITFENFVDTHGKSDRCAGCVARVRITTPNNSTCHEK